MKNLKVKSILFSLLAMMAVAVFMTSCEQAATTFEDDIVEMSNQNDEFITSIEDLPVSPDEVWAAANAETETTNLNTDESLDSRGCERKVKSLSCNTVKWNSSPQYALWIYHYNSSGNYIGTTREDVPSCGTWIKSYTPPPGRYRSVAFVGYQYLGTRTVCCPW